MRTCGYLLTGYLLTTVARNKRLRCAPVLPLLLLSGCGSELAEVHGTVSLDGHRLSGRHDVRGTVLFSPRERGQPMGTGTLDESGAFTASVGGTDGLPPGPYLVTIAVTRILPPNSPGGAPSGKLITPKQYADPTKSGLHADVQPGSNTFDFMLFSQANP